MLYRRRVCAKTDHKQTEMAAGARLVLPCRAGRNAARARRTTKPRHSGNFSGARAARGLGRVLMALAFMAPLALYSQTPPPGQPAQGPGVAAPADPLLSFAGLQITAAGSGLHEPQDATVDGAIYTSQIRATTVF